MKKHSRIWILIILIFCLVWLSSCDGGSSLSAEITRGESLWHSHDLQNYTIEVAHTSGTWHYQTHKTTVWNGEVVETSAECVDAPMDTALDQECEVQDYEPESDTVPGLFALAWGLMENYPTKAISIEFDPEFGFPTTLHYDDPDLIDEEQTWGVKNIEIFEGDEESYLSVKTLRAESLWKSHGLQNYYVEAGHASGLWHYQIHYITVRNGVAVEASANCVDTPMDTALEKSCEVVSFNSNDYTVSGLFRLAYQLLEKYPQESLNMKFDPVYGFPTTIRYDDPDMVDEDQGWGIKALEILEE